jgi:hypothetical protein
MPHPPAFVLQNIENSFKFKSILRARGWDKSRPMSGHTGYPLGIEIAPMNRGVEVKITIGISGNPHNRGL